MKILNIKSGKTENLDLEKIKSATSVAEIRDVISYIACKSLSQSKEYRELLMEKTNGITNENDRVST